MLYPFVIQSLQDLKEILIEIAQNPEHTSQIKAISYLWIWGQYIPYSRDDLVEPLYETMQRATDKFQKFETMYYLWNSGT